MPSKAPGKRGGRREGVYKGEGREGRREKHTDPRIDENRNNCARAHKKMHLRTPVDEQQVEKNKDLVGRLDHRHVLCVHRRGTMIR